MKNYLLYTFLLVLLVTGILLSLHFLPSSITTRGGGPLRPVDLLSALRSDTSSSVAVVPAAVPAPRVKPAFVDTCKAGMTCIEDYSDSTMRGMCPFYAALSSSAPLSRPVRIAYFGDSFIEGDILTGDLRALFQSAFGGCGVGYVPITSAVAGFRQTVLHSFGGWDSFSAVERKHGFDKSLQDLSGRYFLPHSGAYVQLRGQSRYASHLDTCEVSTLYFLCMDSMSVRCTVNGVGAGTLYERGGRRSVQALAVTGDIGSVRWEVARADSAIFYGVAMDGRRGVCIDNFSMRSSSGLPLSTIPLSTLQQFNALRHYDLIILQYGLNVASKMGVDYSWYLRGMSATIEHLKASFPDAGILLVGMGDREYRASDGELHTMPGVLNLISCQQALASEQRIAFWNMYEAMGGEGSIVEMAHKKMANLDYTHITSSGGRYIAGLLFETMMYGKEQYDRRKEYDEE